MNKKIRIIIWILVGMVSIGFIVLPIVLDALIDKEVLKTTHNKEIFDGFVLNLRSCLANDPVNDIDKVLESCEIMDYHCDSIIYDEGKLKMEDCNINGQLFSYENGQIIVK